MGSLMRVVRLAEYRADAAHAVKAKPRSPQARLAPGIAKHRIDPVAAIAWLILIPLGCAAGWYGICRLAGLIWSSL